MKTLLVLAASVLFLWGCQTTQSTAQSVPTQEVEKVAPEIVIERDDGYKAVNYQKLTALLIEAVKELKEEIKELKKDK